MKTQIQLAVAVFIMAAACQKNTDNLFADTPTQRISKTENKLSQQLLASPAGYKAVYFPDHKKTGGFLFYMQFNSDGTVEMTSNVDSNTDVVKSSYKVQFGSTVELNFDSNNHIHKLSDSNLPLAGKRGTGYGGNSTFQYQKIENGKIYFKEYRRNVDFVLEPVSDKAEWDNVKSLVKNTSPVERNLKPTATSSTFQVLFIDSGNGDTQEYAVSYDEELKYITAEGDPDKKDNKLGFGLAYDQKGFLISPPLKVGGTTLDYFTADANGDLVATSGNASARISFYKALPKFVTDYTGALKEDYIDKGKDLSILRTRGRRNSESSPAFVNIMQKIDRGLRSVLLSLVFSPEENTAVLLFSTSNSSGGAVQIAYVFKYKIENKLIFLTFEGIGNTVSDPQGSVGQSRQAYFQPLLDFFTGSKGLYFYNLARSYTEEVFNGIVWERRRYGGTSSATLTSVDRPELRAYLYIGL